MSSPNILPTDQTLEANFSIGPGAVAAYQRLSYTMWHALAEFVDNSTQSFINYQGIIDLVLEEEGNPLRVEITYNREERTLTVSDNSIGMTHDDLVAAMMIANPTKDSVGRSKYGMGMKTAACWIGKCWSVTTCEWGSGEEWTATVDLEKVANNETRIPLSKRDVGKDEHYTIIKIWNLNRTIQKRSEETIMAFLGSMYRIDIREGRLVILFNDKLVPLPDDMEFATYETGAVVRLDLDTVIGNKKVKGWVGVLSKGSRKYGGFSLFQNNRQIRGYPDAWKPRSVFGGVDDEGGNTLVSQRLVGEIVLDQFDVSHTKDAIQYMGDEEHNLEDYLVKKTYDLKRFASSMRKGNTGKTAWDTERLKELLDDAKAEFSSPEFQDAVINTTLPPIEVIRKANQQQAEELSEEDVLLDISDVGGGIRVQVAFKDQSEYHPHLIFTENPGGITVIINKQHPYFVDIESVERVQEIVMQYVYDAVAESQVGKRYSRQETDAIRRMKSELLKAKIQRLENRESARVEREMGKAPDNAEMSANGS